MSNVALNTVYEILKETQNELHSEYVMSATLEELFNQNFLQDFKEKYMEQMIQEKHYYARVLFMLYSSEIKKLPFKNPNAFYLDNTQPKIEEIPEKFEIAPKNGTESNFSLLIKKLEINNCLDSIMIDIITFSLIPSLYFMFLEEDSINSFCNMILSLQSYYNNKDITRKLHYKLARSLFISPMFLFFIRRVMHNILQPMFDNPFLNNNDRSKKIIQQQIKSSFSDNICMIPSYIQVFLNQVKDTFNFLKECLFLPIINNPALFLVIDVISESESSLQMKKYSDILNLIFDDQLIQEISQIIVQNKDSENSHFIYENKNNIGKLESGIKIIDSVDLYAFHLIEKYIKNEDYTNNVNNPNADDKNCHDNYNVELDNNGNKIVNLFGALLDTEYKIYKAIPNENNVTNSFEFYNATQIVSDDYWMHFRKLLKDAQPLPFNYKPPDEPATNDSFLEMVNTFLVETGDPATVVDTNISFELFKKNFEIQSNMSKYRNDTNNYFFFTSEKEIRDKMKNLVLKHNEQEISMQQISKLKNGLISIREKREKSMKLLENVFNSRLIDLYLSSDATIKIPTRAYEIVPNPLRHNLQFEEYFAFQSSKAKKFIGNYCKYNFFHRFYKYVTFYSFLNLRPEIRKYDLILMNILNKYDGYDLVKGRAKLNKMFCNINVITNCSTKLKMALQSNTDPLTKSQEISGAFYLIRQIAENNFNLEGQDDMLPLLLYILPIINPFYIVSNLVFLYEFLFYRDDPFIDSSTIRNFSSIIEKILKMSGDYKNFSFMKLCFANSKKIELFVTGNNSELIVTALTVFITSMNNKDESIDGNRIKNEIDEKSGTFYSFSKNVSKLPENIFYSYFNIDFKVGKNIQFPEKLNENDDYALRMAVFCYKDMSSGGMNFFKKYPYDVKQFIAGKEIQSKIILCEDNIKPQWSLPNNIKIIDIQSFVYYMALTLNGLENPTNCMFPLD